MQFSVKRILALVAVTAAVCWGVSASNASELATRASLYRGMAGSLRSQARTVRKLGDSPGLTARMVRRHETHAEELEDAAAFHERATFDPSKLPSR